MYKSMKHLHKILSVLLLWGVSLCGISQARDSFGMTDGVRVYKERNKSKHFWGPTQAGISLVWTIGSK
ncbi:MAG: hypothetical protein EGQ20_15640 [Bacteroides oleiciplenus]|nr:hypothetical protein [Bacteroides oleiciplenus]